MADPIDLSMVVSSALPSTFAFLYQRLDALLSRHRADPGTAQPEAAPEIPAAVVGELELPLRPDEDRVQARLAELRAYALGLAHYRANSAGISPEDSPDSFDWENHESSNGIMTIRSSYREPTAWGRS